MSEDLDLLDFLVDQGRLGDWELQGLPTDSLSKQNGVVVTASAAAKRSPLLIDPQGQALRWIKCHEAEQLPPHGTTTMLHRRLLDQLTWCLQEGKVLIIEGVEESINSDPTLDPVLEMNIVRRAKSLYIDMNGRMLDYDSNFKLYLITRLPNPHFSPELQAKMTVVDFTVTVHGLEEQLLGRVIQVGRSVGRWAVVDSAPPVDRCARMLCPSAVLPRVPPTGAEAHASHLWWVRCCRR